MWLSLFARNSRDQVQHLDRTQRSALGVHDQHEFLQERREPLNSWAVVVLLGAGLPIRTPIKHSRNQPRFVCLLRNQLSEIYPSID